MNSRNSTWRAIRMGNLDTDAGLRRKSRCVPSASGIVFSAMTRIGNKTGLRAACGLGALLCATAFAQDQEALSLQRTLELTIANNGTVRAAFLDLEAARSRVRQAFSLFLPSVTPSFRYDTSRSETYTGSFAGVTKRSDGTPQVTANWRLLDSGEREWSYQSSRRQASAAEWDAIQTVRNLLFQVHQQYYDALRAQELMAVSEAQLNRAETILKQTDAQIEVGMAPKKDRLQANADFLNAQVQRLQTLNQRAIALTTLKATLAWPESRDLPKLMAAMVPQRFPPILPLAEATRLGLANRPDLQSRRQRLSSQRYQVLRAERDASFSWTLDASYVRQFGPDVSDQRALTFLVSIPLFDGNFARESARQARLSYDAFEAELVQAEHQARAEIESAHVSLSQDIERVHAAIAAREAAQLNYEAAVESQKQGAEGTTVITVLTAQVSLVTAELNYVEAVYDYLISEMRLRLAVGESLPGEES